MLAALLLLIKLLPLYLTVALGWLAGRHLNASGSHIAGIMLYIITPGVVFSGVMHAELSAAVIALPLLTFSLCALVAFGSLWLARRWLGPAASMIPLAVGTGNTGYFGIPLALLLFGEQGLALYIVCMLGTTLFENSLGFYLAARGRFGVRDCLRKVARLPSLYAFALAVLLNLSGVAIGEVLQPFFDNLRGAYSIFGMMLIGMGIGSLGSILGDWRFTVLTFAGKFLLWPLLALALVWLDSHSWQIWSTQVHQALLLISILPVAANTVVIATLLGNHPRQVAGTTLLSTLFALLWIPLMVAWLPGL